MTNNKITIKDLSALQNNTVRFYFSSLVSKLCTRKSLIGEGKIEWDPALISLFGYRTTAFMKH